MNAVVDKRGRDRTLGGAGRSGQLKPRPLPWRDGVSLMPEPPVWRKRNR